MKPPLALVAALATGAAAWGEECTIVNDAELSLGGLAVGIPESAVRARFGSPSRGPKSGDDEYLRLEYPGLTVWIGAGHVVHDVASSSGQYCTPAGLCPGMPFEEVRARYGVPRVAHGNEGSFLEYPTFNPDCRLQIAVRDRLVRSVRATCRASY